jgi:hypothetical protein
MRKIRPAARNIGGAGDLKNYLLLKVRYLFATWRQRALWKDCKVLSSAMKIS